MVKIKTSAMNYIPNAASLPKGMAHYWFELGSGGDEENKNYFLFCQTSDQRIHHASKSQLMEFLESKTARRLLLLKPWHSIEGKRKRKEEKEKEKQQQQEPKKKKQKAIVLPAPAASLELPPEILVMILHILSEPTPDNRRIIFSFLEGPRRNTFSDELTSSELIWKWYRKVLNREPPVRLMKIGQYYMQRREYKPFARRWYSDFVHVYDLSLLSRLHLYYHKNEIRFKMKKKLRPVTIDILMRHVRGKNIGSGSGDGTYGDNTSVYEMVEIEIQGALDATREIGYSGRVPDFMKRPLQYAMLSEAANRNYDLEVIKFIETWYEDEAEWFDRVWIGSNAQQFVEKIINNIFKLNEWATRVMRGLGPDKKFTARDLTAYVWLNQVLLKMYYMPLLEAMEINSFPDNFMFALSEELRIIKMSQEEEGVEDRLSVAKKLVRWGQRQQDYWRNAFTGAQGAWTDKWRLQKSKGITKGKEKQVVEKEEMSSSSSSSSNSKLKSKSTEFWN